LRLVRVRWLTRNLTTMPGASPLRQLPRSRRANDCGNPTSSVAADRATLRTIGALWRCREYRYRRRCCGRSYAEDMDCPYGSQTRIAGLGFPAQQIDRVGVVRRA